MEIGDWRPLFPTRPGEELGDIGAARLNVYGKESEQPLLNATSEFYAREAASWIGSDSCPEYLKKVYSHVQHGTVQAKRGEGDAGVLAFLASP